MWGTCCASSKPKWGTTDWGLGRLEGLDQSRQLWFWNKFPKNKYLCPLWSFQWSSQSVSLIWQAFHEISGCLTPLIGCARSKKPFSFHEVHLSPWVSLSRSLWIASHPSGVLTAHHSLVSSTKLLMVHSVLMSVSLVNLIKCTDSSTDPLRNTTWH